MVTFWIEIIIFAQNDWWLRSPNTGAIYDADRAYYVKSDGDVFSNLFNDISFSYGVRSPITYGSSDTWHVYPSGDVDYDYIDVNGSCGRKNRRTRILTSLLVMFSRPVMSSTMTSSASSIPTVSRTIGYSKFIQKYWWLRSPVTAVSYYAYLVGPDGSVDYRIGNNVSGSYGIWTSIPKMEWKIIY